MPKGIASRLAAALLVITLVAAAIPILFAVFHRLMEFFP